jgi:hypothetical protein
VKKVFGILAISFVVLIGGLLVYIQTKPDNNDVQREAVINAPAESIYPLINDFHTWTKWSPYEQRDPNMRREYTGSQSGVGAIYTWNGNKDVGRGRMEILESTPSSKIKIKLDFLEPFEGHNTAEFILVPSGDATKITWHMYGPGNYATRIMHCVFDMDKMIGTDFETGLANLKTIAEKGPKADETPADGGKAAADDKAGAKDNAAAEGKATTEEKNAVEAKP